LLASELLLPQVKLCNLYAMTCHALQQDLHFNVLDESCSMEPLLLLLLLHTQCNVPSLRPT
jgi:hypothetical protein